MTAGATTKPTGAATQPAGRPTQPAGALAARPALSLAGRALKLLAQREHSRVELERKLAAHEQQSGDLAAALDALQARGLISDERVAASVLHRRAARLGSARLRHELKLKGLDDAVVAQALEPLRGTEVERAQSVWRSKFDALPTDARARARQARFLAGRGFGGEVIARVLRGGFGAD